MRWKLFVIMLCLLGLEVLPAQAQDSSDLLARINALRAQHGLPAYTINGALTVAAQQQAQWIVDTGTIAHTHPDGSGPRTRAVAAGYTGSLIGENIYGGTNASLNDAWVFWLNSPIHYAGLVNTLYQQVGIGIAHAGWGSSFVIDFGGDGSSYVAAVGSGSNGGGSQQVAAGPPPYYGGVDDHGNIKHIVQPGETLGDIALLYGYTWADLPTMMQLNGLSNVRDLVAGSIFLVPPKVGTYTPTPDNDPATSAPAPTSVTVVTPFIIPSITPFVVPTAQATASPTSAVATAGANVLPPSISAGGEGTPTGVEVALLATPAPLNDVIAPAPRTSSATWILIAVAVQVVVVLGAGVEFLRRTIKRRR